MINARDELKIGLVPPPGAAPVEWRIGDCLVDYDEAVAVMQARAAAPPNNARANGAIAPAYLRSLS